MTSRIQTAIAQKTKQRVISATVLDVVGTRCSVQLSGSGLKLKGVSYIGPKPLVGQSVLADYSNGTPVILTSPQADTPVSVTAENTMTEVVGTTAPVREEGSEPTEMHEWRMVDDDGNVRVVISALGSDIEDEFGVPANILGMNADGDIKFYLDANTGLVHAVDGFFDGTITAHDGTIGGFDITDDYLIHDTGLDATSAGMAPSDYPFYAGAIYDNRATAPFRVTPAGVLHATGAIISGQVTADSGFIGGSTGWVISTNYIKDVAGLTGLSNLVTVGDDIRFWAGNVTPGSAPFRVTESGALTATSATISGTITIGTGSSAGGWMINSTSIFNGSITLDSSIPAIKIGAATNYLVGTGIFMGLHSAVYKMSIGNPAANYLAWDGTNLSASGQWITGAGMNPSLQEWTTNIVFSSASATQVNWTSGTVRLNDGTTYAIVSGNTGTMAALTYIYLDVAVSLTVLQITTTYSTANGSGKIIVGVAQNNTTAASIIPFGGQQPILDGGAQIAALSIVAASIAAGAITASKISVTDLSAVNTNTGSLTVSGTLSMPGASAIISIGSTPPTGAALGTGLWVDRTVLSATKSSKQTFALSATDGSVKIGSDLSAAATTGLVIAGSAITYNSESLAAGAMLFGDNSSGKANMLWDVASGRLLFRGGTTSKVYIDTDGTLVFAAGGGILSDVGVIVAGLTTAMRMTATIGSESRIGRIGMYTDPTGLLPMLGIYFEDPNYIAGTGNLITTNPGAEAGAFTGMTTTGAGWSNSTAFAHAGTHSFKLLTDLTSNQTLKTDRYAVIAGTLYLASAWMKTVENVFVVRFYDASVAGTLKGSNTLIATGRVVNGFSELAISVTAPTGATYAEIYYETGICIDCGGSTITLYIDDFYIGVPGVGIATRSLTWEPDAIFRGGNVTAVNGNFVAPAGGFVAGGDGTRFSGRDNGVVFAAENEFWGITAGTIAPYVATQIGGAGTFVKVVDGKVGFVRITQSGANTGYDVSMEGTGFMTIAGSDIFELGFYLPSALTNMVFRIGFKDTLTTTAPVDGAWVNIAGTTLNGKTSKASVVSTTGTSYALSSTTFYRIKITASASLVTFYLYSGSGSGGVLVWSDTLATNIPTSVTGIGVTAYKTTAGTVALIDLDWISYRNPVDARA